MTRKTRPPLDFSSSLEEPAADVIDEAVAAMSHDADAADLEIAKAPDADTIFEPEPTPIVTPLARRDTAEPASSERRAMAVPPAKPAPVKGGGWPYGVALIATLAWLAVPVGLYALGADGPFGVISPVVLLLLAIGPIVPFWAVAYVMAQGSRLAAEARYARAQADDIIRPVAIAAGATGDAVELIRDQIDRAVAAAGQARHELVTLREVLASETAQLVEASAQSAQAAAQVAQSMGAERREISALTEVLKAQAEEIESAITRQSSLVGEAADLADAKVREAEARLAATAADLAAASSEASGAARTAGEDLSRQAARLEAAGTVVVEQVRTVEDSLAEQRAALVTVAHELRAEQESFGAEVESRQAQLSHILATVRGSAAEIAERAEKGGETLQILVENAAERFRALGEAAATERDHFSAEVLKSVGAISEAARNERELFVEEANIGLDRLADAATQAAERAKAEHARMIEEAQATALSLHKAAEDAAAQAAAQTDTARAKVDQLSEAAFAAGQQAEAAFEARLADARALIERSAALVEEAGGAAANRLSDSLGAAQGTIERLEKLLEEVEARTSRLPAEAERREADIRSVVEKGVDDLLGAARRAADETQAIDAAFQERVRRNYEMLSEAVRLMGVVGGAGASPRPRFTSRPPTLPEPAPAAPTPAPAPAPAPAAVEDAAPPPPPPATDETPPATQVELRPRLKLTSGAVDEDVFADAPAPASAEVDDDILAPAEAPGLSWREILSHVDESDDAPVSGVGIITEIRNLGIDPDALLPKSRLDELAPVLQAGDAAGAREVVRQLAPAAMRRLSRRILTDPPLRGRVVAFSRDFESRIGYAAAHDPGGFAIGRLLETDEGRAYLLTDAALNDG